MNECKEAISYGIITNKFKTSKLFKLNLNAVYELMFKILLEVTYIKKSNLIKSFVKLNQKHGQKLQNLNYKSFTLNVFLKNQLHI